MRAFSHDHRRFARSRRPTPKAQLALPQPGEQPELEAVTCTRQLELKMHPSAGTDSRRGSKKRSRASRARRAAWPAPLSAVPRGQHRALPSWQPRTQRRAAPRSTAPPLPAAPPVRAAAACLWASGGAPRGAAAARQQLQPRRATGGLGGGWGRPPGLPRPPPPRVQPPHRPPHQPRCRRGCRQAPAPPRHGGRLRAPRHGRRPPRPPRAPRGRRAAPRAPFAATPRLAATDRPIGFSTLPSSGRAPGAAQRQPANLRPASQEHILI